MKDFRKAIARLFAPEQRPTAEKVRRNFLASVLRSVLIWPIPFFLIPFVPAKIGAIGYGTRAFS